MSKNFVYKTFLKEIASQMHQADINDNHELANLMEKKAFELNIDPIIAITLINYFWDGYVLGLSKFCYNKWRDVNEV
jgi:hypothetical protein